MSWPWTAHVSGADGGSSAGSVAATAGDSEGAAKLASAPVAIAASTTSQEGNPPRRIDLRTSTPLLADVRALACRAAPRILNARRLAREPEHERVPERELALAVADDVERGVVSRDEELAIAARVGAARGSAVPDALLAFSRAAYLAFQLGYADDAARAASDRVEARRWSGLRDARAALLRDALAAPEVTPTR